MIKRIDSTDNKIVKLCTGLGSKKIRDKEGKYLIEGSNLVEEAINNGAEIEALIIREGSDWAIDCDGSDIYIFGDKAFDRACTTESPQGVMAILKKSHIKEPEIPKEGNMVALDHLQDPGNIGTIIRTADAAGYKAVIAIKGTVDVYSPKVVRAAAGSLFRVPIIFVDSYEELISIKKRLGKRLVVTSLKASKPYYDEDLSKDIILVIGNEGNGVSKELVELADARVIIPMEGKIESLNASIAAAILMYEAIRSDK